MTQIKYASRISGVLLALVLLLVPFAAKVHAATTLLPNGEQCFQSSAGPVAGGSIYFYQPGTNIFKQTWQDANQSVLNSQPVSLDANGRTVDRTRILSRGSQ